jgi:hypothetical protein
MISSVSGGQAFSEEHPYEMGADDVVTQLHFLKKLRKGHPLKSPFAV